MIFHWKKQPEHRYIRCCIANKTLCKAQKMSGVQQFSITLVRMGHLKEHHLLGRLRCHIFFFYPVLDDCWVFLHVVIRETQKLVPSRNLSHLEPQKFVPANHKNLLIRKIKLPQNFHATRYHWSCAIMHARFDRRCHCGGFVLCSPCSCSLKVRIRNKTQFYLPAWSNCRIPYHSITLLKNSGYAVRGEIY